MGHGSRHNRDRKAPPIELGLRHESAAHPPAIGNASAAQTARTTPHIDTTKPAAKEKSFRRRQRPTETKLLASPHPAPKDAVRCALKRKRKVRCSTVGSRTIMYPKEVDHLEKLPLPKQCRLSTGRNQVTSRSRSTSSNRATTLASVADSGGQYPMGGENRRTPDQGRPILLPVVGGERGRFCLGSA